MYVITEKVLGYATLKEAENALQKWADNNKNRSKGRTAAIYKVEKVSKDI